MIHIAVVDDEPVIAHQIKNFIQACHPECQTDTYQDGENLLAGKQYYDIVFIDIQMEGMDGIQTAKKLRTQGGDSLLIFITGIRERVFEAFDVKAFHYLLKPVEDEKLREVLEHAIAEVQKVRKQTQKNLFIQTKTRNVTLKQRQILYIESRGKKVEIHTTKEMIEIYASMRELEKQLGTDFYRCHRGYLVNLAYIREYSRNEILLSNGDNILLSKEKYSEFIKVYMRYLRNGGTAYV